MRAEASTTGRVEYSILEHLVTAPDYYTNGVDVIGGTGWVIRNNLFRNIRASNGLAGPAVLFWGGSRDALVDGNTFIDCQREIVLGLEATTPDDNTGGVVRNNFIYRAASMSADSAISVGDSPNTQVLHNTVFVNGTYPTPIEYRFPDTTGVVIRNNLLDGSIGARDGASGTVMANHTAATASMFVNPAAGDLHLKSTATTVIDRVSNLEYAPKDWDGESRPEGSAADFGADEVKGATSPPSQALTELQTSLATGSALVAEGTTTLVVPALPSPWLATSIGSPAVGGSATYASGTFTIKGAGADIAGTADQFHFAYRTLTGNGEIVARIASLQDVTRAKAGVMIREGLTAASRHAFAAVTPGGVAFQRRLATGASSWSTGRTGTVPHWVRLVRSGSMFSAYRSTTGTSWTLIGSETIPMAATVYVGLAVTSRNVSALATATFTGATVTAGTSNAPPSVSLTSPLSTATFNAPAMINVTASASDSDGTIASVKFYAGSTLIGSDTSSPYSVSWLNVPAGTYVLTAVAVDDDGASRTSGPVSTGVGASITLPRQLIFTASADHATNVTSYRMDIFVAGANPATAIPVRTQNLGKPPLVNGDITVDIAALVQALPTGSYFVTVTALGPGGSARSSPSATFTR